MLRNNQRISILTFDSENKYVDGAEVLFERQIVLASAIELGSFAEDRPRFLWTMRGAFIHISAAATKRSNS